MRRALVLLPASLLLAAPASTAELTVSVQIPRLEVAEYHRPYVAIWIERVDQSTAAQLAVWYQTDPNKEDGRQWLKDLRQWWRRGGRELQMPVDGLSGATRPVGEHSVKFSSTKAPLKELPAGDYQLVVEAAREVGGRELLKLPFTWPVRAAQQATAQGKTELGAVKLALQP